MSNGYQSREIAPENRSGFNNTGSTIVKGTILVATTTPQGITPATTATGPYIGVAGEDIPTGAWGRVVERGVALVLFNAALTVGARITANGTGKAVAAAAGNAVFAIAQEAGAANTLAEAVLVGPGGLTMPT
jgi:hypothetical protein